MTALTLDQTRVWVGITTLAITTLVLASLNEQNSVKITKGREYYLACGFVLMVLTPAIEVTYLGQPQTPFQWLITNI
jgi:hypothetical protein